MNFLFSFHFHRVFLVVLFFIVPRSRVNVDAAKKKQKWSLQNTKLSQFLMYTRNNNNISLILYEKHKKINIIRFLIVYYV